MGIRLVFLFLFLLVSLCVPTLCTSKAKAWNPQDVANPKTHPSLCVDLAKLKNGPVEGEAELERMWVCDPDGILKPTTIDAVNNKLYDLSLTKRSAECQRGTQVGVVVIERMATGSSEEAAESFAKAVHDSWGVGDRKCNNGVIFLLAIGDRKWYISTGAGVKKILNPLAIAHIKELITPDLKSHDYDEAVLKAVSEMATILKTGEPYVEQISWVHYSGIAVILYIVACGVVAGLRSVHWYLTNAYKRRVTRKAKKHQLDELARKLQQGTNYVPITMCPICLESLIPGNATSSDAAGSGSSNDNNNNNNNNDNNNNNNNIDVNNSSNKKDDVGTDGEGLTPKLLFCGHKFHKTCIDEWLARNDSCPICRRQSPTEPEAPAASQQVRPAGADADFLLFANARLYHSYSIWNIPPPPARPPSIWDVTTPNSGGSSSFGGGMSFGGGGGGGSW